VLRPAIKLGLRILIGKEELGYGPIVQMLDPECYTDMVFGLVDDQGTFHTNTHVWAVPGPAIDPDTFSDDGNTGSIVTGKPREFYLTAKSHKLHYQTEFAGMPISIENRAGSYRYWYDHDAKKEGKTLMRYPYGYIRLTEGKDGDHVDCYIGPNPLAHDVYIVRQNKAPDFKTYDEDKVMLGFDSAAEAKAAYIKQYDDPRFFGRMDTYPLGVFRAKVAKTKDKPGMVKSQKTRVRNLQNAGLMLHATHEHKLEGIKKEGMHSGWFSTEPEHNMAPEGGKNARKRVYLMVPKKDLKSRHARQTKVGGTKDVTWAAPNNHEQKWHNPIKPKYSADANLKNMQRLGKSEIQKSNHTLNLVCSDCAGSKEIATREMYKKYKLSDGEYVCRPCWDKRRSKHPVFLKKD